MINIGREWFINVAISFDGKISKKGEQIEISSKEDWEVVHSLRNNIAAIVVGSNTIIVDNPSLKTKSEYLPPDVKTINHPVRVVLDRSGNCDPNSKVFQDQEQIPTLWVTNSLINYQGVTKIQGGNLKDIIKDVNQFCDRLGRSGDIMVEGGSKVINAFINSGMISKMRIYRSNRIIEDGVPLFPNPSPRVLELQSVAKLGPGIEEIYRLI